MHRRLGPDTAAAGEGGRGEWWAMRVISPISLKRALSPPGGAGEHAPRVRARVDEREPRDRRTTVRGAHALHSCGL